MPDKKKMDKLLLIDDEDVTPSSAYLTHRNWNWKPQPAVRLEVIKPFQPDLVLMDVRMGGITGWRHCRIRQDDAKLPSS